MRKCEDSNRSVVVALYTAVILGALLSTVIAGVFSYRWVSVMDHKDKQLIISRLCFTVILCLSAERLFKVMHVFLVLNAKGAAWYIIQVICEQCIFLLSMAIFACLNCYLIRKLHSFDGSVYEVSKMQIRVLYVLTIMKELLLYVYLFLVYRDSFKFSKVGRYVLFSIAIVLFGLGMSILGSVDFDFGSNLRSLVATTTAVNGNGTKSFPIQTESQDPGIHRSSLSVSNGGGNGAATKEGRSPTLAAMRMASISQFSVNLRGLLQSASKSMVISLSLTVSFIIYLGAGISIIFAEKCGNWSSVLTECFIGITYVIVGSSITLGMRHSHELYQRYCLRCNRWVTKIVAFKTKLKVMELTQKSNDLSSVDI